MWREHLDTHWDHKHNTHTLWKTIHGLANKTPTQPKNNTITFKEKTPTSPTQIANAFTNTVKHKSHKTNIHIDRNTLKLQTTNIILTTTQVQVEIKQSKNNNSTGPDKLNIRHLKHIGPLGLAYLTDMYLQHITKQHHIIPIPKLKKDINIGTSYRPNSLLSVIAQTLEKTLFPYITATSHTSQHNMASKATTLQA